MKQVYLSLLLAGLTAAPALGQKTTVNAFPKPLAPVANAGMKAPQFHLPSAIDDKKKGITMYAGQRLDQSKHRSWVKWQTGDSFRDLEMPTTVQNKDNVELVCLLIDGISGHIVNAAKCEIDAEAPVSAIRETRQQLVPVFTVSNGQLNLNGYRGTVSVYDASGKQVSADHLQAGLYILRATDGNQSFVQKVVVR